MKKKRTHKTPVDAFKTGGPYSYIPLQKEKALRGRQGYLWGYFILIVIVKESTANHSVGVNH